MKSTLIILFLSLSVSLVAQEKDSVTVLQEVTVKAYEANRPLLQVPASIGLVTSTELARFNNTSLVSAVNNIPGIRMEERSPGSYRFSIRGSSLRSPFGVRNVKVYWNELPLTDPGGNTYINQLDANVINQLEIIKGPGSSLYGAGTGGVVLLSSPDPEKESMLTGSWMGGSYGLSNYQLSFSQGNKNTSHYIGYQHQKSDGYRVQTNMVRDQVNSFFKFSFSDKEELETTLFYTDLYYQTPGGLNAAEYEANPQQARPAAGIFPSAVTQNASVSLRSFYTGVSHQYQFSKNFRNRTGVYGNFVQFNNSAIRNYERRLEQNFGARSVTELKVDLNDGFLNFIGGGEFQHGYSPVKNYQNLQGTPGLLQDDDEIRTLQYNLFGQAELSKGNWILTGGLSLNWVEYTLIRLAQLPVIPQVADYDPVLTPRLALLRKINESFSLYGNVSWGFSPPTLAEVRPSNGVFNPSLKPEKGRQYELGMKNYLFQRKLYVDMSVYSFRLDETIVVRRDANGADYFVNAGATDQNGLEMLLNWQAISSDNFISSLKLWSGVTINDYHFKDYSKNSTSYSGNRLTGTPNHVITGGVDLSLINKININLTVNNTSSIPLDDANTVYADAYTLLGMKVSYKNKLENLPFELFAGGDNLLNEKYSLGNDLNAAGGRYFNAATPRNYFFGLKLGVDFSSRK